MFIICNNVFMMCGLIYFFFRGEALLDEAVAKGKITKHQAAARKRWLRPLSAVGVAFLLFALFYELARKF